jgi:hypothetical protein
MGLVRGRAHASDGVDGAGARDQHAGSSPTSGEGGFMAESDKVFAGSIPKFYDTLMVPLTRL